jgi:uncharacterized protein (DUF58 family)
MWWQMKFLKIIIGILRTYQSRPTKYFVLLFIMIVGLFLFAYMYNHNIVFIMMFTAFSLALGSSFLGRRNLYELELTLAKQKRLFAHSRNELLFNLTNRATYKRYAVFIASSEAESSKKNIEMFSEETFSLSFADLARGIFSIPTLKIHSYFPFSHELFNRQWHLKESVIIYPEPKGKTLFESFFTAQSLSGEREDFDHLRGYRESDSMSLIYWPSVAKGEMLTKEFIYEQATHFFALDYDDAGQTHEEKLSQLCKWVLECEAKEADFSVKLPDGTLHSKGGTDVILAKLALS